jgi:hypothetical protein
VCQKKTRQKGRRCAERLFSIDIKEPVGEETNSPTLKIRVLKIRNEGRFLILDCQVAISAAPAARQSLAGEWACPR